MTYLWLKTFHLVGVVSWFAGLFYLVRLFIYRAEAIDRGGAEGTLLANQFALMERRLMHIITTPAAILSAGTAIGILVVHPSLLQEPWMWAKLVLVAVLVGYHAWCLRMMTRLDAGDRWWTSRKLRGMNEVPTLLLVLGVMLAVFKRQFPTSAAAWVIVGLGVLFLFSIQLYAKHRRREAPSAAPAGVVRR